MVVLQIQMEARVFVAMAVVVLLALLKTWGL